MGTWSNTGPKAVRVLVDQSRPEHKRRAQVDTVEVLSDHFGDRAKDVAAAEESWLLLLGALADPLPWVRATALSGLNEIANVRRSDLDAGLVRGAYGPMAHRLRDPDSEVRARACSALMSCADVMDSATADWAVRSVGSLLHDPVPKVRAEAIRHVANDSIPAAWEVLPWAYQWLGDPHPEIREAALSALWFMHHDGQHPAPPDVPGRVAYLLGADPEPRVREQAADTLPKVAPHDPRAIDTLIKALHDPDYDVRHKVIFALGDYGPMAARAVGPLRTLADGEHDDAVDFALEAIGTPWAAQ
jgi:HEAT repeat protein